MTSGLVDELVHGTAAAAMRGCDCRPCRRRLAELAGERVDQLELPYTSLQPRRAPTKIGPVSRWRPLPAGLLPALPAGGDAIAGLMARQELLGAAADAAEAARRLLERGLARPAGRSTVAIPPESARHGGVHEALASSRARAGGRR